ncbi:hypothetical protein ACFLRQ_02035 [Bacteroidota bacterium]
MKKRIYILIALALFAGHSCQEAIDIEKEKEAIIAIIEEERNAWFDKDIDRINAVWYQGPESRKIDVCKYCGTNTFIGWTEIHKENLAMVNKPPSEIKNVAVQYSDYNIIVSDNTALAYHIGTWTGILDGEDWHFVEKRILHFRKIDGEWKFDLLAHYSQHD